MIPEFVWPKSEDYEYSMMNLQKMALDDDIRAGKVEMNEGDFGVRSFGGAKLYTATYKVSVSPSARSALNGSSYSDWMVRCFCATPTGKPPADIAERYQRISEFCLNNHKKVSALLPVYYVEKGLKVFYIDENTDTSTRTEYLPIVKMPFLHAPSLGSFVAKNHKNQQMMRRLYVAWLHMIRQLEQINMAHGDLDLTNVLVLQEGADLTLKLIDYDNMWVPALNGRKQTERGKDGFQHPHYQRPYNAEMDRFSALVIYISLRALFFRSHLYNDYGANDTHRLLFSKDDYQKESQGNSPENHIAQLRSLGIPELAPYLDELSRALRNRCMPCSLDTVPLPVVEVVHWDVPAGSSEVKVPRSRSELRRADSGVISHTNGPTNQAKTVPDESQQQISQPSRQLSAVRIGVITVLVVLIIIALVFALLWFANHPHSGLGQNAAMLHTVSTFVETATAPLYVNSVGPVWASVKMKVLLGGIHDVI